MKKQNYNKGRQAEKKALSFLKKQKYKILHTNWRCKSGEIDIIAEQKAVLCFIEVKYRRNKDFGSGFAAVDLKKQKKLISLAKYYISISNIDYRAYRFDVIQLEGDQIDIVVNAIEQK